LFALAFGLKLFFEALESFLFPLLPAALFQCFVQVLRELKLEGFLNPAYRLADVAQVRGNPLKRQLLPALDNERTTGGRQDNKDTAELSWLFVKLRHIADVGV
jgi:hypothetical protein